MNLQYRDSTNLSARARLYELFGARGVDWNRQVFDQLDLPDTARVLELGCGPGALWVRNRDRIPAGWHVKLTDLSEGMIEKAQVNLRELLSNFSFEVLDAQTIPYETESFDAVIANHMLYHVDNREKAFAAIRSVLKEGGSIYATTNGAGHLRQLRTLVQRVKPTTAWSSFEDRFSLESGAAQLSNWFEHVNVHRVDGELRVNEVQPLIDYVQSTNRMRLDEEQQRRFSAFVEQQISVNGAFRIATAAGVFVATKCPRE